MRPLRTIQLLLLALSALFTVLLIVRALHPTASLPWPLAHFGVVGEPIASSISIGIVVAVLALLCIVSYRTRRNPASAATPVMIVIGLFLLGFVLALASYWKCDDSTHASVFTALSWAAALVEGEMDEQAVQAVCGYLPPIALEVARLAILAAFALGAIGVAAAAFRLQADRMRVSLARSITVVVDADEDAESIVSAIANESSHRGSLALLTSAPDNAVAQRSRTKGARVLSADFTRPETVGTDRLWRRIDRLYLLAPDPSTNLARLRVIHRRLADVGTRRPIFLIMRIDDPWLAKSWRSEQFGGSDTRWVADAVGKYEVTARRLLDQILSINTISRVFVCGTSQLTLALCAEMTRRLIERDFFTRADEPPLPTLTLIDPAADEYRREIEFHEQRRGFGTIHAAIEVLGATPSASTLIDLLSNGYQNTAVIFVDGLSDPTIPSRLAGRYLGLPIFAWDAKASVAAESRPIVGQLHMYRLGMDLPRGQAHDNFDRAAMLIHERYSAGTRRETPASVPWDQLDEFYRKSNRRLVRNTFWMVEQLAGHTWNTWGMPPDNLSVTELDELASPIAQLNRLGFDDDAIEAMAQAEFEDWNRYMRRDDWQPGEVRDFGNKRHEKLVGWERTKAEPELMTAALSSLATTLIQLRLLGYRSAPLWRPYRRSGTVRARRTWTAWTWQTGSGDTMRARPGDWQVSDATGHKWSVRDNIFRSSYRRTSGNLWAATGVVFARRANPGEIVDSLEGRERTGEGDWIVQGDIGEQWPVPDNTFRIRYTGPVSFVERFTHLEHLFGRS